MQIYLSTATTTHYLAGQSGVSERTHSSAGGFRIEAQAASQLLARIRAATAPMVDRGNLTTTITFSTSRLFATAGAAFLYALDHDTGFVRQGVLYLDAGTDTRALLDCVVSPPTRRVIGCTVLLDYTATGSKIVVPAP